MYADRRSFSGNLHALRGLAATSVVLFHAKNIGPNVDVGFLGVVQQLGAGVTLFFVLSGFSLALANHDRINSPDWLWGYALRRMARILPVWYLFLAAHVALHWLKYGKVYGLSEITVNAVPVFALVPGKHESIVWAGWTVGIELIFYTVLPFLLVLLGRNAWMWLTAAFVAFGVSLATHAIMVDGLPKSYYYMSFQHQLFVFVVGSMLFFWSKLAREVKAEAWLIASLLVVCIACFSWWTLAVASPARFGLGEFSTAVKAIALGSVVALAYIAPMGINLLNRMTKFLGDKSFTIYLSHPIIVAQTKFLYPSISSAVPTVELAFLAYCGIVLLLTCLSAHIITTYLEEPVYEWGSCLARIGSV